MRTRPTAHRAAYLQLAARCARAPQLADAITHSGLPLAWTTNWASWLLQPPHQALTGHTGRVASVAFGAPVGRPVVVSGGDDGTVRLWDPTTGTAVGDPLTGHSRGVVAVAFGEVDGRTILAAGGRDGTVRAVGRGHRKADGRAVDRHRGGILTTSMP